MREASLAAVFGATQDVDAYLMAQVIPLLFLGIVSYALTTTFIPIYSHVRAEKGREEGFRMANTVIRVIIVIGIVLVVLGEVLAEPIVGLVAPGFDGRSADLTVYLSRIIFPMMVFQLVSGIATGMLQAEGQFSAPEIAGLVQNLAIIGAILIFGPRYGITAVALGLLIGVLGALIVKLSALVRLGFRWKHVFDLNDPDLRRMLILMIPALIGAGAGRINGIVDRILASSLPEGRVAALNYGVRLYDLAPGIMGGSIITVMYPTLSQMAAKGDWQRFTRNLARGLGFIHFLLTPIAAGAIVLREPLVRIVYERGAFDAVATQETAWTLLFLAVGMAFRSMRNLIARGFFALKDTTTPMFIGLAVVGVNIVANLLLVGPLAQGGLALGTSLAGLFGLILSVIIMQRKSPVGLPLRGLASSVARVLVAAGLMGWAVWVGHSWLQQVLPDSGIIAEFAALTASVIFGAIVYVLLAWVMRVPEVKLGWGLVRNLVTWPGQFKR